MSVSERVRAVVEPVVAAEGVELFDLEQAGPVLRVTIDRGGGLDMEAISAVTRALSRALDEHDPISGQYTLEVSSPGLERTLRTPDHFAWAVGRQVSIKTVPGFEAGRRFAGTLNRADVTGVVVDLDEPRPDLGAQLSLRYDDIEKARTVFEWGPAPKPGGPKGTKGTKTSKTSKTSKASKGDTSSKSSQSRGASPTATPSTTQETVPE